MKRLAAACLALAAGFGWARAADAPFQEELLHSQLRLPDETFQEAARRYEGRLKAAGRLEALGDGSVFQSRVPYVQVKPEDLPAWGGMAELYERFYALRDRRFLETPTRPGFARRISWLYPDDGCFARAAMARKTIEEWGVPQPAKVFIFGYGGLRVETPNHPAGFVEWWYHVAQVVSVEGRAFVLDPAVEPRRPLPLEEWVLRQNRDLPRVTLSLCGPYAYAPDSSCLESTPAAEERAPQSQRLFLGWEWNRQQDLGRRPELVLGDEPPWSLRLEPERVALPWESY